MPELARFAGAVAVVALVTLATTQGPALGPVRVVDAIVVALAAATATACAVMADVRRAQRRDTRRRDTQRRDAEPAAHSPF